MRDEAQCVIIGGGAMGVGLLYHLAHQGWTDTLLIEKGELTSGSTWHAAGLVPHFIGSLNMAKVHAYGVDLYNNLEAETGMSPGWHGCGAIRLAVTDEQAQWYRRVKDMLELIDVEAHLIGPNEIPEHAPLIDDVSDIKLGFWTPNDGWADPTGSTNAMATGARQLGATIARHTLVTGMRQLPDHRWEITWQQNGEQGTTIAEHVVNAAGHYGPQLGAMAGLDIPIVSMIHQYLITEPLAEIAAQTTEMPVVRDPRSSAYYRYEIDGLLVGPYERAGAETYGTQGIDWDLHFHLTPPNLEPLMPWLEHTAQRIPAFANAGIKQVISGPITHTPDGGYLMGPAPGLKNYWLCVGASIGITQGPGAGKYLAQWMVHGQTEINIAEMDPRRFGPWATQEYTIKKSIDEYHEMYQVRLPGEHRPAGRPMRQTPIHENLDALGAQWQDVYGWERVAYYGEPEQHSWQHSNAFDHVAHECAGVRNRVGLADLTAFAKFEVTGPHAAQLLDRITANRLPATGGLRLSHLLTSDGGIEAEVTITRLSDDRFYLNSGITSQGRDFDLLRNQIHPDENVTVTDVTGNLGLLAITGPHARDVLATLTESSLATEDFRWLTGQEITVAGVDCLALRVSYVGELGWELHHPIDQMPQLYAALVAAGQPYDLVHFGSYAMNALRLEKGYKGFGSELTTEITPIEAGLERFVDYTSDFTGKDAVQARQQQNPADLDMVLVYASVDTTDYDCRGNEPCYAPDAEPNDPPMGITTSGDYGHHVGQSLCFAYVTPAYAPAGQQFSISLYGQRHTATVLDAPAHDPTNEKLRT